MASNPYVNKVIYGNQTLIDLTADTAAADKVLSGYTFHDASGASTTGTCNYDSNTQDATAVVAEILNGKTAYARGAKITGSMPNNGAVSGTISIVDSEYSVAQGYHDGSGKVSIASAEQAKIIADNIKNGVTILGVTGTYGGETHIVQANKNVTPTASQQAITPDAGYDCLGQVTVYAIPYSEVDNSAGGKTATIG